MRPGYSWPVTRFLYLHEGIDVPWSRREFYVKLYNEKHRKKRRR